MIPAGKSNPLSERTQGRPHSTWVVPNTREKTARLFSDLNLEPKETASVSRRKPDLDDLANEARYNDSLIASHERRRQKKEVPLTTLFTRAAFIVATVAIIYLALVVFAVALTP